jgi:hypothetical protein
VTGLEAENRGESSSQATALPPYPVPLARNASTRPAGAIAAPRIATTTQVRQELRQIIARAVELVCGAPIVYLDTLAVLLRRGVSARALADLGAHCGAINVQTSRACASGFPFRMTMAQPQNEALRLIEEHLDHIVSEFHIAYDLPARTAGDAEALTSVIQRLAIQPWHGSRKSRLMEKGVYASDKRRTARNFIIYGDKPSKVTNRPCSHVELRFNGAAACRARGVRTCGDLLSFDATKYLDRDIKLGLIDWQSARQILRQLADRESRRYPHRFRLKVRLNLIKRTIFDRLTTPDHHTPSSFDDHPVITQRALDVVPAWSSALVSSPFSLLYARA